MQIDADAARVTRYLAQAVARQFDRGGRVVQKEHCPTEMGRPMRVLGDGGVQLPKKRASSEGEED